MQESDDIGLLREYVEHRSERAFAALVGRHINKVYSAALRHTRNPGHAEEITQAVFVILAKKAPELRRNTVLSGWLYQTARLASVTFLRSEIRRTHREQEAHMQSTVYESANPQWEHLAPLLDEAMATLGEKDRNAVVLRFFDGKSLKDVGAAMAASEDASKKRVQRSVEKLRNFFTRRGVRLSAAVLCGVLSANAVQAAPAHLAASVAATAAGRSAVAASTLTLVKGALKFMAWMKVKTAVIVGTVALLAAGTTTVAVKVLETHLPPIQSSRSIPDWGDVIDPDGDCVITTDGTGLRIEIPGTDHVVMPERKKMNGPRVLQEVEGDFDAVVKVNVDFPPAIQSVATGRNPYQDAGLFVWLDEKTHLKFACAQEYVKGKHYRHLNLEWRRDGIYRNKPLLAPPGFDLKSGYLWIQRRGDTLTASASADGENWYELDPVVLKLPRRVRVGVEAQNNTSSPLTAEFDEFQATPPE